jgi:hypothetical protein
MEKESSSKQGAEDLGLSEQAKFDVKKSPRPETSEQTQRPLADKASIKSDRGTFPTK